jgi:hypothetical protein
MSTLLTSRQQVNLLPEALKSTVDWLSPVKLYLYMGLFVTFLLAISAMGYWELERLEKALEVATSRKESAELALKHFRQLPKNLRSGEGLAAQLKRANETLTMKSRIVDILEKNNLGYSLGYSRFFEGLRQAGVSGLNLHDIKITDGDNSIVLGGEVIKSTQLAEFLTRLGSEEAFVGRPFEMLELYREEASSRSIMFGLATQKE